MPSPHYTLKVPYGPLMAFMSALRMGSTITDLLMGVASKPELMAQARPQLQKQGLRPDFILEGGKQQQESDKLTKRALEDVRKAVALAGVFPAGHPMATGDDQVLEIALDEETIRELFTSACMLSRQLRTMLDHDAVKSSGAFPLGVIFEGPFQQLRDSGPVFLRAALEAGAPLF